MGSFQAFKASAAQSRLGRPGATSTADTPHYFGFEVERRLTHPPAKMVKISQTAVTPDRILSALTGNKTVFPGMPVMEPVYLEPITKAEAERLRLKREREERQRIEEELRNQGNGRRERQVPGAFGKGKERY